jgi:hypothetical protein
VTASAENVQSWLWGGQKPVSPADYSELRRNSIALEGTAGSKITARFSIGARKTSDPVAGHPCHYRPQCLADVLHDVSHAVEVGIHGGEERTSI